MAGGFTIDVNKIALFRKFLLESFERLKLKSSKAVDLFLDTIISPSAVNEKFYEEIEFLAPFGSGNNEPKFAIENLKVIKSNIIGKNHIKSILIGSDGSIIKSIAFNAKDSPLESFLDKKNKKKFSIAGKMNLNDWKGNKSVQFIIEDISL